MLKEYFMFNADFLTLILIAIFALPILIGAFTEFSRKKSNYPYGHWAMA